MALTIPQTRGAVFSRTGYAGPLAAVVRRELRIFLRYPSWVVGMIIWPVLFPLIYLLGSRALAGPEGQGLSAFARLAGTSNVQGFIVIGTTAWMWLNITLWAVGTSLRTDQVRGVLESNWLTPAPRFALLLGTAASQAVLALAVLALSLVEFRVLLGIHFSANVGSAVAVVVLTIPWVYGLAMAFAAVVLRFKEANAMVYLVRGVFMVFAGITFPLTVLPDWMARVAAYLPLTHTIEALRAALLQGAGPAALRTHLAFLFWSGMLLLGLGYYTFHTVDRLMRRAGTVGHH
ncbi:MAG TPA: ABC transporter permease [bacterium]|nr:ABC transporter permease [bacterium]